MDFENLPVGSRADRVCFTQGISGFLADPSVCVDVKTSGGNAGPLIFDAACGGLANGTDSSGCSGGDTDLFQPMEGNVLILQEDRFPSSIPNDDASGGCFTFYFNSSAFKSRIARVYVASVDLLDIEEAPAEITALLSGGGTVAKQSAIGVDGGIQQVEVNADGVTALEVCYTGDSGAVGEVALCLEKANAISFRSVNFNFDSEEDGAGDEVAETCSLTTDHWSATCSVAVEDRVRCGDDDLTPNECIAQGCCFDSKFVPAFKDFYDTIPAKLRDSAPRCFCAGVDPNKSSTTTTSTTTVTLALCASVDHATCDVDKDQRELCGHADITMEECTALGCCYDADYEPQFAGFFSGMESKFQDDSPKCFCAGDKGTTSSTSTTTTTRTAYCVPVLGHETCSVPLDDREVCGHENITMQECAALGCCFDESYSPQYGDFFQNLPAQFQDMAPKCFCPGERSTSSSTSTTTTTVTAQCTDVKYGTCKVEKDDRKRCGWANISMSECDALGCCFDSDFSPQFGSFFNALPAEFNDDTITCFCPGEFIMPETSTTSTTTSTSTAECKFVEYPTCAVAQAERKQCGDVNISFAECTDMGCCYDTSFHPAFAGFYDDLPDEFVEDAPKCFCAGDYHRVRISTSTSTTTTTTTGYCVTVELPTCDVEKESRATCGDANITVGECKQLGCCFDPDYFPAFGVFYDSVDEKFRDDLPKCFCPGNTGTQSSSTSTSTVTAGGLYL